MLTGLGPPYYVKDFLSPNSRIKGTVYLNCIGGRLKTRADDKRPGHRPYHIITLYRSGMIVRVHAFGDLHFTIVRKRSKSANARRGSNVLLRVS